MKRIEPTIKRPAAAILLLGLVVCGALIAFNGIAFNGIALDGATSGAGAQPELVLQLGHSDSVRALAFSPDGRTLASGGDEGDIILWSAHSGELIRRIQAYNDQWVRALAFSRDGDLLVTGATPKLWHTRTWKTLHVWSEFGDAGKVAFSADGRAVASGNHRIKVWDTTTKKLKSERAQDGHDSSALAFSPDGTILVSGGSRRIGNSTEGEVQFLNADNATVERTLPGADGNAEQIAFSPDGKTLAFGAIERVPPKGDGTDITINGVPQGRVNYIIQLRDVENAQVRQTLRGIESSTYALAFSGDGSTLVSGDMSNMVRIWEVATGTQRHAMRVGSQINPVAITPDGTIVASVNRREDLVLWDARSGRARHVLAGRSGRVTCLALSGDGRLLAHGYSENYFSHNVRLWDIQIGALLQTREVLGHVTALSFSPDNQTLKASLMRYDGDKQENEDWWMKTRDGALLRWKKTSPPSRPTFGRSWRSGHMSHVESVENQHIRASIAKDESIHLSVPGSNTLLATLLVLPDAAPRVFAQNQTDIQAATNREGQMPSSEWIAYTPGGHYIASPGAEKWIRWRVGERLLTAEEYSATFHRPDMVQKSLRGKGN